MVPGASLGGLVDDVRALVAEHEVDQVAVAGTGLLTLLALSASWLFLVTLGAMSDSSPGSKGTCVAAETDWGTDIDTLTRTLRSRQLEHPLDGLPQ